MTSYVIDQSQIFETYQELWNITGDSDITILVNDIDNLREFYKFRDAISIINKEFDYTLGICSFYYLRYQYNNLIIVCN